jgi:integrase
MSALTHTPDYTALITLVGDACVSPLTRRAYLGALRRFFAWFQAGATLDRGALNSYRAYLIEAGAGQVSINQALAAVRLLAREAAAQGMMDQTAADSLGAVEGVPIRGSRTGNWLSLADTERLLAAPDIETVAGRRDAAIFALLVGAWLRRQEAVGVQVDQIQQRGGRWLVADLQGKGGRTRTVPLPAWAATSLRAWVDGLEPGPVLRRVRDEVIGGPLSVDGVWYIVKRYADELGGLKFAPHDLRRTGAQLARAGGAEIEQIQFTLGHSSVVTTERYLGGKLDLDDAAVDRMGIKERKS